MITRKPAIIIDLMVVARVVSISFKPALLKIATSAAVSAERIANTSHMGLIMILFLGNAKRGGF